MLKVRLYSLVHCFMLLMIVTGCATSDAKQEERKTDNQLQKEREKDRTTAIFTYYSPENEVFRMYGLEPDYIGERILFKGEHIESSDSNSTTYVTTKNEHGLSIMDMLHEDREEIVCPNLQALSPNGDFLVYQCNERPSTIYVYNLLEKRVEYKQELTDQSEQSSHSIITITNAGDLVLGNRHRKEIYTRNIFSDEENVYPLLEDIADSDGPIQTFKATADGKLILLQTNESIYTFDLKKDEVELIQHIDGIATPEKVEFFNAQLSSEGTYLYFEVRSLLGNSNYFVTFVDLQTNQYHHYEGLPTHLLKNITDDGRVLVIDYSKNIAEVYLFFVQTGQLQRIQLDSEYLNEQTKLFELAPSGESIVFSSVTADGANQKHELLKMSLSDDVLEEALSVRYKVVEGIFESSLKMIK